MRVDFSGRGVVAPDPALRLDQCGLPVEMAFVLYRLHLAGELVRAGHARTPAAARRLIDARSPLVRAALEALVAEHPVILSVGRCLSRHGIQAFFPVLGPDEAIKLSPLAIQRLAGDRTLITVKVFLPLGDRAQQEACQRLTSPATLVAPETRKPRIDLSPDARAGLYLASLPRTGARGRAPLPAPRASWSALQPGATLSRGDPELRRLGAAHLATYGALRGFFASLAEVERAIDAGELSLQAHVFVRHGGVTLATVAGRCPVLALLPPEVPSALANTALDRKALDTLLAAAVARLDPPRAARLIEALEALGLRLVTARGLSLCVDDLPVPAEKEAIVAEARRDVARVEADYQEGMITDGERYNKTVDLWAYASDRARHAMNEGARLARVVDPETGEPGVDPSRSPLFLIIDAGVAGDEGSLRAMAAMRGLMAKPSQEIFEVPIVANLREGLGPHEALMDAMRDRGARVRRRRLHREDRLLAEVLVRALGRVRIVARDCGALGSLPVQCLTASGDVLVSLADRVRGRVHAETGHVIAEVPEDARDISIRSPIFCEAEGGVCAACHGQLPGAAFPGIGERVGLHAAHAIASQLARMRTLTFHIGAGSYPPSSRVNFCEAAVDGVLVVALAPDDLASRRGERVALRGVDVSILDGDGIVVPSGALPYGAILKRSPGERVSRGDLLAEWDQFTRPVLAHHDGVIRWVDLVEGETFYSGLDEITGLSRAVVFHREGSALHPALGIVADDGVPRQASALDAGAFLVVKDGARVSRGDEIARLPLPYVAHYCLMEGRPNLMRLLHARTNDPAAVLNEIRGVARMARGDDGAPTIVVQPTEGSPDLIAAGTRVYSIPRRRSERVYGNEIVAPGAVLVDGNVDPRDIARVLGPVPAARYLVDELQLIHALFGVPLEARHAEIVARALLAWVRVLAPGEGPWEAGTIVPRTRFDARCRALVDAGRAPPRGEVTVQGLARRAGEPRPPRMRS